MKRITLLLLSLFYILPTVAQGILSFEQPEMHLKDLMADDRPHTVTFTMTNTGTRPVIISRVTPMTSQFKADWTREPLAPGKKGTIRITFTPGKNIREEFSHKIIVTSNAKNGRQELLLAGNLVDNPQKPALLYRATLNGVKFKASNINFGEIFSWQTVTDTMYYYNPLSTPVTVTPATPPPHLTVRCQPATLAPGKRGYMTITYDAPRKGDFGYCYESLFLNVNGRQSRLTLSATLVEDFSRLSPEQLAAAPTAVFDKKEADFGTIRRGAKADCHFRLTNTGKSPLFIRATKASCGCTAVNVGAKALAPGQSTSIRITFDSAGKSGRQYKNVTIITNDPAHPATILKINGNITAK